MAIKNTVSFTVGKDTRTGSRTRLVSIQNYCCSSKAIAIISKCEKQALHFVQAFFVTCYFIVSRGCYDKDASLWSRVP